MNTLAFVCRSMFSYTIRKYNINWDLVLDSSFMQSSPNDCAIVTEMFFKNVNTPSNSNYNILLLSYNSHEDILYSITGFDLDLTEMLTGK